MAQGVSDETKATALWELRPALSAGRRPLTARPVRLVRRLVVLCVLAAAGAVGAEPERAALTEATVIEHDGAVEVWIRLTRPARYQSDLMDAPWRLVLDFQDTAYRWSLRPVAVSTEPVRELRGSQFRVGVARLVIELSRKVTYAIDEDREGVRIVLPRTAAATPSATTRVAVATPTARGLVLHGVLQLAGRSHAYIYDPAVREVRRYAAGDRLGDAVVETIGERHVVLRTPAGPLELRVRDGQADAAPKPRPAARPR